MVIPPSPRLACVVGVPSPPILWPKLELLPEETLGAGFGACFLAGQAVLMQSLRISSSPSDSSLESSKVKADKLVLELDFDIQLGVPSTQNFFTSSPNSEGVFEKIRALEELLGALATAGLLADLTGIPERAVALFMLPLVGLEKKDQNSTFFLSLFL